MSLIYWSVSIVISAISAWIIWKIIQEVLDVFLDLKDRNFLCNRIAELRTRVGILENRNRRKEEEDA